MMRWRERQVGIGIALLLAALSVTPLTAEAQERWAMIVSGPPGGEPFATQQRDSRVELVRTLGSRYGFAQERIRVLSEAPEPAGERASAENLRARFAELRGKVGKDDLLLIVLLGHGTYDGDAAKFNLLGPDLSAREWGTLISAVPGRLVLINTTESSFPFVEALSARGRVVITATDSPAQKYSTVFGQYLVKALGESSTDLDKNGRTSIYEVFSAASAAVKQHYEQRGQLTTERPVIDDNGDRAAREDAAEGPDGAVARTVYLEAEDPVATADPAMAELFRRRRELEREAEELRTRKAEMPEAQWQDAYEKLMLELARVTREIRSKPPGR